MPPPFPLNADMFQWILMQIALFVSSATCPSTKLKSCLFLFVDNRYVQNILFVYVYDYLVEDHGAAVRIDNLEKSAQISRAEIKVELLRGCGVVIRRFQAATVTEIVDKFRSLQLWL